MSGRALPSFSISTLTADLSLQNFLMNQLSEANKGFAPTVHIIDGPQAPKVMIGGREVLMLSSNNYLGLTNNGRVEAATKAAIEKYGVGLGCGRSIVTMRIQLELEQRLATFKKAEAALVFPTGYDTNFGTMGWLTDKETTVVLDEFNHASVFDGLRFSGAKVQTYPHKDLATAEKLLKESDQRTRRFLVTPSIFPLEGDIADLPAIVEVGERYGATVYTDDAHAVGILGRHGRGIVDHFGLHGRVEVQVGTLSKALASVGGYVAGSTDLREFLFKKARPFAQSTGHLAPPSVAAVLACLDILEEDEDDSLIKKLWSNADYFREGLRKLGFDTGVSTTPIIPVILRDASTTIKFSQELFQLGILVRPFAPPAVAEGTARLRTIVSATHTREELDFALESFAKVGRKLNVGIP